MEGDRPDSPGVICVAIAGLLSPEAACSVAAVEEVAKGVNMVPLPEGVVSVPKEDVLLLVLVPATPPLPSARNGLRPEGNSPPGVGLPAKK